MRGLAEVGFSCAECDGAEPDDGAAALFGASTPASKYLLDGEVGPITLAGLLYLGAALATAPFSRSGGAPERRREPTNLRRLAGAVFFGGILGPILLLVGLRLAPSASRRERRVPACLPTPTARLLSVRNR